MARHGSLVAITVEIFIDNSTPNPGQIQSDVMDACEAAGMEVHAAEMVLNTPKTVPDKK